MHEVFLMRYVENCGVHGRSSHGKIISLNLTLIVFAGQVLNPVRPVGECMEWRRRRVGGGIA